MLPPLRRRHFLQLMIGAMGTGLMPSPQTQATVLKQIQSYRQQLAQNTSRKLALLVGINDYPDPISHLQGCVTDVDLQYQLFVHRFGFQPQDILILTDNTPLKPTRANILQAFEEHLIQQAKPGDVVVFHFSGHGSLVRDPAPLTTVECESTASCGMVGAIVPSDTSPRQADVSDILGSTLFLLMLAIQTENLTVVLDSCFSGGGLRGNVQVRSRLGTNTILVPSDAELDYQQQWLARLQLTAEEFQQRRRAGIAKGVALGSAGSNQEAMDVAFNGFHAGAFTYLLTRYLWQLPSNQSLATVQANLVRSTRILSAADYYTQIPVFAVAPGSGNEQKPMYFLDLPTPAAEAVVTEVAGDRIQIWLGGISLQQFRSMGAGTVYTLTDVTGQSVGEVVQKEPTQGLIAYGELFPGQSLQVTPGMLLRERLLGIAANPTLTLGVDPALETDLSQIQTAFLSHQGRNWLEVVPGNHSGLDYTLGRMTAAYRHQLALHSILDLPPVGSMGLFTPSIAAIVPNSFGDPQESIDAAVIRLKPLCKLLLARQVLQLIVGTSSTLQINGEIFAATRSGSGVPIVNAQSSLSAIAPATPFRSGEAIQFRVENPYPEQDLYLSCLAIDAAANIIALYPADWQAPEESARIERQGSLVIPRPQDGVVFQVQGAGSVQLLTLISTAPLRLVLKGLQTIARNRGITRGFLTVQDDEPLQVIDDLLDDLDTLARGRGDRSAIPATTRQLDTTTLAIFSTVIEIQEVVSL